MVPFVSLLVALALAVAVARTLPESAAHGVDIATPLSSRWAGLVVGTLTAIICAYVWGHLIAPTAVVHDEASYLLQAGIFARGAFAMPAPPLPEFFEQFHTYVTPAFASKYPPGHALLLAIGVLVGWPALVPLLLDGIAGATLFLLGRRIANPVVGLLAWLIWITAHATFRPLASYFSETSSIALWLLGWWALLEWRDGRRPGWLVALAACIGWCAITRPLTAVAFALPAGAVVLARIARRGAWRDLLRPSLVALAILALIPYHNLRTTGDWRVMPYAQYSAIYFPWDAPGLGLNTAPPRRALPPDMQAFAAAARPRHATHLAGTLPSTFLERAEYVALDVWSGPRILLGVVAIAALPVLGVEAALALATSGLLLLLYLSFAHAPAWTLYYAEVLPVLAFLSAAGLWSLLCGGRGAERRAAMRRTTPSAALAASALMLLFLPVAGVQWTIWRRQNLAVQSYQRAVASSVAALPEPKVMVFVRHAKWHNLHKSLIANAPDLVHAHAWMVYDRGTDNERLMRAAPDRVPYLYDEAQVALIRIPR